MAENPSIPPRVELLKIDEVARVLKISKTQAYRLAQNGTIPNVRFGSLVRIRPDDLDRFISDHRSE